MSYSAELVRRSDLSSSKWSGGTTTQIAIYPKGADYSKRNFQWRLSSANVELDESVFTSLPEIRRLIMVLNGEMKLEHEGHHSIYLKPFEQDSFSGSWITRSFGKVRDFNLMLADHCDGTITALAIPANSAVPVSDINGTNVHGFSKAVAAFYCADGSLNIAVNNQNSEELREGDVLFIHMEEQTKNIELLITNKQPQNNHIIKAMVYF